MATQEKLQKSLDALKNLSKLSQQSEVSKKKEKIQHCYVITEAISNSTIRISTNFHSLLGHSVEAFLRLCDDQDSDVRMTSEECLNRIIRAASDGHIGKIQIELHKEIKKNDAARSLRTALWLFSVLAHHIRPHKGKPYVVNLFPSLIRITERTEESVHETLAASLPKIMKALGCFTSENEMKALLKAFLENIANESPAIRRTTISCILSICMNCQKSHIFMRYSLNYLLDMVVPVNNEQENSRILGVMSCIKALIPNLQNISCENKESNADSVTEKLLQVFELCLHYLTHKDHNIINVCLETLNALLQHSADDLKQKLLSEKGLSSHRIYCTNTSVPSICRSASQLSVSTNLTAEENLFSETELTETLHSDIEKWIDESKLSVMNVTFGITKEKSRSLDKINSCGSEINRVTDLRDYENLNEINRGNFIGKLTSTSIEDTLDNSSISEHSSVKSIYGSVEDKLSNLDEEMQEIDIGEILDNSVPLIYTTRLIVKLFLLNGTPRTYISDKLVRVSVKSQALSCLSSIFQLFPKGMFLFLDKNYSDAVKNSWKKISRQNVSGILIFRNHSDPQLRGAIRNLVSNFIKTVHIFSSGNYEEWILENATPEQARMFHTEELINILLEGLQDESATCIRQTLISLSISLKYVAESQKSTTIKPLLDILPSLSRNPYWLVKVALCDLVSKIEYITMNFVTQNNGFQEKVLYNILFFLLGDTDQRVRTSAASAIVEIIPLLYFEDYRVNEEAATSKAILEIEKLTKYLTYSESETNLNRRHFIDHMPFPFNELSNEGCDRIDFHLSKIIVKLCNITTSSNSKHLISGCIETLSLLSNTYPCTLYRNTWCTGKFETEETSASKIPDLLKICTSLLTNSTQVYDLQTHINVLNLAANLYAGYSLSLVKPIVDVENSLSFWSMFTNSVFCNLSEQYLIHLMKLLNVFHHVLNELIPVHPQSKPVLPNLPTTSNLSPIKRRKSDLDKKTLISGKSDREEKSDKRVTIKTTSIGMFANSSHYLKIYDVIKSSFINYKISLDSESSRKFLELMVTTLRSLSVLMEVGSLMEFSRIAEEILSYFRSTFMVDPAATVQCVQQLLKCLFSTNLTANISEFSKKQMERQETGACFYHNVFQKPYNLISQSILSLSNINRHDFDNDSTVMGYLHRKDAKRRSVVLSRSSDKILANYIRIFEPMVIKSLKQYTLTSDVKLQCQVLQLLSQLVQLRVNYCLLDSEQIFIGFVLKQFEFIEEGQIPYTNELLPKIFQFLVQLSYSKQHSKCIISIPKIIQLCDGLMASGQPSLTHCIPALKPIVEDIFLTRNKSNTTDIKELETTREVVLSMLLRLCDNKEVMDLITLILEDSRFCTDNTDKWFEWSKRVFGVVLPMLKQNKLKFDRSDSVVAMRRFILALNPDVFKPFDEIILMFFQEPPPEDTSTARFNYWFSKILILLFIITPLKEEMLLAKIDKLKSEFSPGSIFENVITRADPLNVNNNSDMFRKIDAELIFIRFMFRVIFLTSKRCLEVIRNDRSTFLIEQFMAFLFHMLYILQSGSHGKISNTAMSFLNENTSFDESNTKQLNSINRNFISLGYFYPTLTFQWCYFLIFSNYYETWFWSDVLGNKENNDTIAGKRLKQSSINSEIMKTGGTISYCDYLSETGIENSCWFLRNSSKFLVNLFNEPPVFECIVSFHRNSTLSQTFIESISEYSRSSNSSVYKMNVLKCIENCHSSQIGRVLNLLIPDMLNVHQAALSRMAANLVSRKIELLLTLSMEEVGNQLTKENLVQLQKSLVSLNLVKRHETLVSLLNKLSVQYYDLSPIEFEQRRVVNPEYIKKLEINKKWYLSQIQARYNDVNMGIETAELLSHLEYNEIVSFMSSSGFNKYCLQDCLKFGLSSYDGYVKDKLDIVKASVDSVLRDVASVASRISSPHQAYKAQNWASSNHNQAMTELFQNEEFSNLLCSIAPCIPLVLDYFPTGSIKKIPDNNLEDLMKFAVICLEYINFVIEKHNEDINVNFIDTFISAADEIFRRSSIYNLLEIDSTVLWLRSSVNSLFNLVNELLRNDIPLPSLPSYALKETLDSVETQPAGQATHQLGILVCWLYEQKSVNQTKIPKFLFDRIKSTVICLSRLPVVNSYILIPSRAWKTGWQPEIMSGPYRTQVSQLPLDLLQEIDILEEYIFRINLLGWTSRQQFEETWMCLLSVLCAPVDDLDSLEMNNVFQSSSLAIKSITALLMESLTYPVGGNPNVSKLIHISRNSPIHNESISMRKLKIIQGAIHHSYNGPSNNCRNCEILNVFEPRNFEKLCNKYSYGQVSIKYFLIMTGIIKESEDDSLAAEVCRNRKRMLEDGGLDINSCLQFLVDYYTQLMKPQANTHIRVLHEAIKSTVLISDLFTDKSQFSWMMAVFLELSKLHTAEDELLQQYLIVGLCKAVSVLTPELEVFEQLKKLLVQYLKSPYLALRLACLHGLLYILEGCILSNIKIGGISDEMQLILPCAVEYVQLNLNTTNSVLRRSQEHSSLVWSLACYLTENIEEVHMELNFVPNTLLSAYNALNEKSVVGQLHQAIMKGLERLLVIKKSSFLEKFGKQLMKLALGNMKKDNPTLALLGTQLLLSYMYTDCEAHLQNVQSSTNNPTSPDHLVQTIEKISAIFERIKKGYVHEVEILCSVLPNILEDFFSPSDILTKVIGEFLSPQQPHPKLLSKVVFQVFQSAIHRNQLSLLQDWVVFSLSNFTQSFSIGMATWCLTCFFISASSNSWLRSYFPYVQTRVGRYEYEDRKVLCIAGVDFYKNLTNDKQRQTFVDNFRKVKDQADTPFNDLLFSL